MGKILAMSSVAMPRKIVSALVCAVVIVSGCGTKTGEDPALSARVWASVKAKLATSKAPTTAAPTEDLSWIDEFEQPLMLALIESTKGVGFLVPTTVNAGQVTWRASDGVALTLQNGVITQTRGLGHDIMSAQAPRRPLPQGHHKRVYFRLDGEGKTVHASFECDWRLVGSENVQIINKSFKTTHYAESCQGDSGKITNNYWVDSAGITRQSRQFVSETVGYVSLQRIIE